MVGSLLWKNKVMYIYLPAVGQENSNMLLQHEGRPTRRPQLQSRRKKPVTGYDGVKTGEDDY